MKNSLFHYGDKHHQLYYNAGNTKLLNEYKCALQGQSQVGPSVITHTVL